MNERDRLVKMLEKAEEKAWEYIRENDHMDYIPTLKEILGVYADYLLANGVIVPPCKAGDTVYCYCGDFGVILPYFVENMTIGFVGKDRDYIAFEANCHAEETDELLDAIDFEVDDIGKIVFLTREEAEAALAERRDNR